MGRPKKRGTIVLAIAPSVYGFGFALFDTPRTLLDWGLRYAREDKNRKCLARLQALIEWHQPDEIVLEDASGVGSFRRPRIRSLLRSMKRLAGRHGIATSTYTRSDVLACFAGFDVQNKQQIAENIGSWLTDLEAWVPPPRMPWHPEHHRMAVFVAASLALTHFDANGQALAGDGRKTQAT